MSLPAYSEAAALPQDFEHPPSYDENELAANKIQKYLETISSLTKGQSLKAIECYPRPLVEELDGQILNAEREIVPSLFAAIHKKQVSVVTLFLQSGTVTANTLYEGRSPLLSAIQTKHLPMVNLLLESQADPHFLGVYSTGWQVNFGTVRVYRTPLQVAAAEGHLPLVKTLMEKYHCDDAIIAPDGQIALRLAAENGHREVVDYLPARRGGGFRRWMFKHQIAVRRAKAAALGCGLFFKFFLWDIEKFFLWTVPKNAIVKPLAKNAKWAWRNRKDFLPWCKHQLKQMSARVQKSIVATWKGIKKLPKTIFDTATYLRKHLPGYLKRKVLLLWNFITKKIPHALSLLGASIYQGLSTAAKSMQRTLLLFISLLHTVATAVITFFRDLTLKDIWNGVYNLLHYVFVSIPQLVSSWILKFGEAVTKILRTLFGSLGDFISLLAYCLGAVVMYLPEQIWAIVRSFGESIARGGYEIRVWFNPKV